MAVQLFSKNNTLVIGDLTSGLLSSDNGEIQVSNINLDALQTDVTVLQTDVTALQNEINNLGAGLTLDQTINNSILVSSNSMPYFATNWTNLSNSLTSNMVDMCCSGDGRVVFVGKFSAGTNNSRISYDYGNTWSEITGAGSTILNCAMSLDGKYIVVNDLTNYKISSNYGVSFSSPSSRPLSVNQLAISATGKYIASSKNQGLQVSSDYGTTWISRETNSWTSICITVDGSAIYASSDAGVIKKSIDYGDSWSTIYTNGSSNSIKWITCSGDGTHVLACFNANNQLLLSSDSGANFSLVGSSNSYYKVAMSSNGVYMLASVNASKLCYSVNCGVTWSEINNIRFCAIAVNYTGNIIYNVNPYNNVIVCESSSTLLSTSAPLISSNGSIYFNATSNQLNIYNGTAWKSVTLT